MPGPFYQELLSMIGLYTPLRRGLAGFLLGGIYVYFYDPEIKPWAVTNPDDPSAVYIPNYAKAIAPALVGYFIL